MNSVNQGKHRGGINKAFTRVSTRVWTYGNGYAVGVICDLMWVPLVHQSRETLSHFVPLRHPIEIGTQTS